MKKVILLFALIISFSVLSKGQSSAMTLQNLSKKWKLKSYSYYGFSDSPSSKEKNDYIYLKANKTFSSISEGQKDIGQWRLDARQKRIYLSKKGEKGELVFIISSLSKSQLVLIIDDAADTDAKNLKIYFKSE